MFVRDRALSIYTPCRLAPRRNVWMEDLQERFCWASSPCRPGRRGPSSRWWRARRWCAAAGCASDPPRTALAREAETRDTCKYWSTVALKIYILLQTVEKLRKHGNVYKLRDQGMRVSHIMTVDRVAAHKQMGLGPSKSPKNWFQTNLVWHIGDGGHPKTSLQGGGGGGQGCHDIYEHSRTGVRSPL